MPKLLLLYSTQEGQTRRIAQHAADVAQSAGWTSALRSIDDAAGQPFAPDADAVLLAASVHFGRHAAAAQHFITANRSALSAVPAAFMSVSLSASDHERAVAAEGYANDLLEATGWQPTATVCVAGALRYRSYGVLKRLLMRRIARSQGLPADSSRDYEFTDWDQVADFVREFLARSPSAAV